MTRSRWLFGCAVFLGAFLLFLVEPIAAKQLLPVLGGSAAVWITCLVFFQTALLGAYLYAHWMSSRPRWVLYFVLLLLVSLRRLGWCVRSAGSGLGSAHPILTVFAVLASTIGLPFLVLGTTSPLMQVWWARLHGSAIPYRLFALSNLASLLALGLYPTMIEPHLTLQAQRIAWGCGFAVFAVDHRCAGVEGARRRRRHRCRRAIVAERGPACATGAQDCFGCCCRWARPCS